MIKKKSTPDFKEWIQDMSLLTIFGECSKNEKTKHYVSVFLDLKINLRTEFIFTLLFIIIKQFFFLLFSMPIK